MLFCLLERRALLSKSQRASAWTWGPPEPPSPPCQVSFFLDVPLSPHFLVLGLLWLIGLSGICLPLLLRDKGSVTRGFVCGRLGPPGGRLSGMCVKISQGHPRNVPQEGKGRGGEEGSRTGQRGSRATIQLSRDLRQPWGCDNGIPLQSCPKSGRAGLGPWITY